MILKSISESVYWYGIYFPKYLIAKILPIVHQIILLFKILRQTHQKSKQLASETFKHPWINFIRANLSNIIEFSG